jgi:predicted transcriptional regulator YdeE
MDFQTLKTKDSFNVMGISVRTSNAIEFQEGGGHIPKLWQQFFVEHVLAKIPHKADNALMTLYFDYASDKDGEYNFLLGARVTHVDAIPAGMVVQEVPAQTYAVFTSEQGKFPDVVVNTWQKIWRLESQEKLNRSYKVDYGIYDERSQDPSNAQVEYHIGITG